jgi:hypothetical protein
MEVLGVDVDADADAAGADADADAEANAVASAFGSRTVANISVIRFIVPCMPLTATAVVIFPFCVREGGAMASLDFEPLERFFGGDVGGRGWVSERLEGSEDGLVDCIDGGGWDERESRERLIP